MKILLLGVSCVGKTTVGTILSNRLGWEFCDLDEEVKTRRGTTLEVFVNTGRLIDRDRIRGEIIKDIIQKDEDLVLAVTPISFVESFQESLQRDDIILIELYDTPYHIFQRLVFSDEEDNIYKDEIYKTVHKTHYMKEIQEDLKYYGKVYASLGADRFNINNDSPEKVVERIIEKYGLNRSHKRENRLQKSQ